MKLFRLRIVRPVEQLNKIRLETLYFRRIRFDFQKRLVQRFSGFQLA